MGANGTTECDRSICDPKVCTPSSRINTSRIDTVSDTNGQVLTAAMGATSAAEDDQSMCNPRVCTPCVSIDTSRVDTSHADNPSCIDNTSNAATSDAQLQAEFTSRRGPQWSQLQTALDIARQRFKSDKPMYTLSNLKVNPCQDELFDAARAGDFKKLVQAVIAGANVNSPNLRGMTPLMMVSASKGPKAVDSMKFLLYAQVDLEERDAKGWTSLLHACRNSRRDMVSLLIEKKASMKARANDGKTALMIAALDKCSDLIMTLAEQNARVDLRDERGWSVLFYACEYGDADLVGWLLRNKASVKDQAKDESTPIHISAAQGNKKVGMRLCKKHAELNARNDKGDTPLIISLRFHREEFAEWVLSTGEVSVIAKNNNGEDASDIADLVGLHCYQNKIDMMARVELANIEEERKAEARREAARKEKEQEDQVKDQGAKTGKSSPR